MNIKTKRMAVLFIIVFLALLAGKTFIRPAAPQPGLETFQVQTGGWGYQITFKKKILIYQPTIPAYDRVAAFPDEATARAVGELVLKRVRKNEKFSVSKEEVDHLLKANL